MPSRAGLARHILPGWLGSHVSCKRLSSRNEAAHAQYTRQDGVARARDSVLDFDMGKDSIQAQIASSLDCSIAREKNSRAAWFRSMIVACAREYATLACVEVTPTYVFWLALSEHRVNGGWPGSFDTGWLGSARHGSARFDAVLVLTGY